MKYFLNFWPPLSQQNFFRNRFFLKKFFSWKIKIFYKKIKSILKSISWLFKQQLLIYIFMSFLFIFPIPPPTPRVKSDGKLSFKIPRPYQNQNESKTSDLLWKLDIKSYELWRRRKTDKRNKLLKYETPRTHQKSKSKVPL